MANGDKRTLLARRSVLLGLGGFLAGCSTGPLQLGSRTLTLPWDQGPASGGNAGPGLAPAPMATAPAERFGRGPVPVALLLPLSGDPVLSQTGRALANASRLAMAFIEASPTIGDNTSISLRDTGTTAAGAASAASAAVAEGARLILGPLTAEQVSAAGSVARSANVPLIGFANNGSVAGAGIYVLNVLPEAEMKRMLTWLRAQGRRGPAGIFPATPYGEALAAAFRTQSVAAGFNLGAVYTFSNAGEAQGIVNQAKAGMTSGMIDALLIPDRPSAAQFATLVRQAGGTAELVQLVGSADWAGDGSLLGNPALSGAIFPAVDEAGLNAIRADYQRQFGAPPPQMATIAYTATILANVNTLSMASPPYNAAALTNPAGFAGRDGLFRFAANGRSEYALVVRQVGGGVLDGAKLV